MIVATLVCILFETSHLSCIVDGGRAGGILTERSLVILSCSVRHLLSLLSSAFPFVGRLLKERKELYRPRYSFPISSLSLFTHYTHLSLLQLFLTTISSERDTLSCNREGPIVHGLVPPSRREDSSRVRQ